MNLPTARETLQDGGFQVETVLGTDDIASASAEESRKRHGVAGLICAYKAAGPRAEEGGNLQEVRDTAVRLNALGQSAWRCQIAGSDRPSFALYDA
ncbi:dihydroxyacetone kinase subunit DhaK [Mesorhizobium sp. M0998]|uniref:dihydroxyacetone kinase subunit DhaK n=1 Tax=Mesorhizobium sp. M0998 TaxID=2957044 RepID=UPI003338D230